jgi:hypothetical protein
MPMPRPAGPRSFHPLWLTATTGLALALSVSLARPAGAAVASAPVRVLIGFKQPGFHISSASRRGILSRTRERDRITALHGRVARQYARADAVAATLSPEAASALLTDPSVA